MSQTVGAGFGSMPAMMRSLDRLSTMSATLSAETASGMVSDRFAGLGSRAYQAINLEPQISATVAWRSNLSTSEVKLSTTQSVLSTINTIAGNLQSGLLGLTGLSSAGAVSILSKTASRDLTQLTSLLNTQIGDTYIFAGSASDQAPIAAPDLASSPVVTGIMQSVASVGTMGATLTEATNLGLAIDNTPGVSPFSAELSTSAVAAAALAPAIEVGPGQTVANGIVATQGGLPGTQSTGSPIRDLILCLATVAGLAGADQSSTDFTKLVTDTASQLQGVTQALGDLTGRVGAMQSDSSARSSVMSDLASALQSQLSSITDADIALVASQQATVQNQLSASYSLIADMKNLNLAAYI